MGPFHISSLVPFGHFFQSGPISRYIQEATCFTIFPCVSLGTYAHIAVLLVMCSTLAIVLTRPTDAWRLKRKEKEFFQEGIVQSTGHCKFKSRKEIYLKLKLT